MWQDYALATGVWFFVLALVPTIRDPNARVPRWSSVPTALVLAGLGVVQMSLNLRWAAVANVAACCAWSWIAWQRGPNEGR